MNIGVLGVRTHASPACILPVCIAGDPALLNALCGVGMQSKVTLEVGWGQLL